MVDIFFIVVGLAYVLVVSLLFLFGLNFYYLSFLSLKKRTPAAPPAPQNWPKVTVQLPIYNELYVVERLIESVANLDYPIEQLEIQVLDDSTDETIQLAQRVVDRVKARGIHIVYIHRHERDGYKAGALAAGLAQASGEYLAIFDADFVPGPDFLKRTIPYFQDAGVAFLQTRWGHLNQNYSILTFLQSLIIDAHFLVEQIARSQGGFWFNFNGTSGVWRKSAILDAGGWKADTLTEDLDLSYRASLRGWRAVYLADTVVPAELPVTFSAYRRQQYRWARGSLEVAQKQLLAVLKSKVSPLQKLEAVLHLTGYGLHILLFSISLLYPLVLLMPDRYPHLIPFFSLALLFNIAAFAQMILLITAQANLKQRWWKLLPAIFFVSALGAGMMLNTVQGAIQIFQKRRVAFERTPKFGIQEKNQNWNHKRYQNNLDRIVFFELGFAIFNAWTVFSALKSHNYVISFYAFTFCAGLLFVSGMSLQQSLGQRRDHRKFGVTKELRPVIISESSAELGYDFPTEGGEDLQRAILKTIAYADIFDYAMTRQEIHRYLIGTRASSGTVQSVLETQCSSGILESRDGVYMLPGKGNLVEVRQRRQAVAGQLWQKATWYGSKIAHLPFVRMVAVTGALAMNNVEQGADIDYLIVTEPGRLWLCRGLVILIVHWAARQGVVLCPNYLLSERAMLFPEHSLYAAHELAQMVPLSGMQIYHQLRQLNWWTDKFLPNASGQPGVFMRTGSQKNGFILSLAEIALRTAPGAWLEHWEMERKIQKLNSARPDPIESDFSADWCKGHFNQHGQKTRISYLDRLEMLGLLDQSNILQVER